MTLILIKIRKNNKSSNNKNTTSKPNPKKLLSEKKNPKNKRMFQKIPFCNELGLLVKDLGSLAMCGLLYVRRG